MKRMKIVALAGCLVFVIAGCSSSEPAPQGDGGTPPPSGWRAGVGQGGLVLQTFDDRVWVTRIATPIDLYAVTCVGNTNGWAVGASGTILHTIDGGLTWSTQTSGVAASLRGVHFSDAMHGVAAGDLGALVNTDDGGATWTPITIASTNFTAVAATDAGHFFVVGDGDVILESTDSGVSFASAHVTGAMNLRAVAADSSGALVIAGDAKGQIFSSTDGGQTFHVETTSTASIASLSIGDDTDEALAAGDAGTILHRTAAGVWSVMTSGTSANLRAAMITATFDYAAGDDGTLLAFHDGAWSPVSTTTHATIYALDDL